MGPCTGPGVGTLRRRGVSPASQPEDQRSPVRQGRGWPRRRLLRQSTTQGRAVLQRVLDGRIVFTPTADGVGYTFEAPTRFDRLFASLVVECPAWVDPSDRRGKEHLGPEDTFDGDYGSLLEQATVKAWCALQDSNLRPPGS